MSDLKQARVLLMSAERDISALRGMADVAVFADEIFGFHAQQAAEKLLKAWLALLGETYPTTHDLARLLAILRERDVEATRFNELVEYTPFAVQFRYVPGDLSARPLDRDTAIERVEALLKEVRRQFDNMGAF